MAPTNLALQYSDAAPSVEPVDGRGRQQSLDEASSSSAPPVSPPAIYRGKILELDALRAVGILVVILNHTWPAVLSYKIWILLHFGWLAMDSFFVMSGFLIGGILLDSRLRPDFYKAFYTRRALRILPLYYLVIISLIVISAMVGADAWQGESPWWYFVYLGSIPMALAGALPAFAWGTFGPLWSLQLEEQFYLLFPPLVRRLQLRTLVHVLIGMVVVSPILRVLLLMWYPSNTLVQYVLLPCRMEGFALGGLLAVRFRRGPWSISKRWLTCLTLVGLAATIAVPVVGGLSLGSPLVRTLGFALSTYTSTGLVLWLIVFRDSRLTACLRWRPVQYLGKISYGMYLLHKPVVVLLPALGLGLGLTFAPAFTVVGVLTLTIVLASISWRYFESPLLSLRDRVSAPRTVGAHVPAGRFAIRQRAWLLRVTGIMAIVLIAMPSIACFLRPHVPALRIATAGHRSDGGQAVAGPVGLYFNPVARVGRAVGSGEESGGSLRARHTL